jgi:hypothetical protein
MVYTQAPAPNIIAYPWFHQGLGRGNEGEGRKPDPEPLEQGSKGPSLTLGERRWGLSLLLCKVKGGRRWEVLHPTTEMKKPSL